MSKKHKIKDPNENISDNQFYINKIKLLKNLTDNDLCDIKNKYMSGYCIQDLRTEYNFDTSKLLLCMNIKLRTASESKKTERYILKYKNTVTERYGIDNVSKLVHIKNKKKETFIKNYGYENNFCNKDIHTRALIESLKTTKNDHVNIRKKYISTCQEKYGTNNVSQDSEISKKISNTKKRIWSKVGISDRKKYMKKCRASLIRSQYSKRSLLEERIEKITKKLNFKFFFNRRIARKNVDILIKGIRVVVEIQGDYFHATPLKYKATDYFKQFNLTAQEIWNRDTKKKNYLENKGYTVLWLWERDIRKMTDDEILLYFIKLHDEHYTEKNKINTKD